MREIKFRAWAGGVLVDFDLFNIAEGQFNAVTGERQFKILNGYYVGKKSPIMQYTGLKDKNGKEIYEGDLVEYRIKSEYPAEVYFDERDSGYRLRVNGEMQYDKTYPMLFALRVVGNIYKNPELLKEI